MHERHTGVRAPTILNVLKEGTPDVLKRPKNLLSRSKKSIQVCTFVCNANPYTNLAPYPRPYMARKKKPPPLHVSLHRIQLERNNVALRTEAMIAKLLSKSISSEGKYDSIDASKVENVARHGCLNAISICFCVLLLLFCHLFLQWHNYTYEITIQVKQKQT